MKKELLIGLSLLGGLFSGCEHEDSATIDPSVPFYQSYQVEYNVSHNKTYVAANFKKDNIRGESVELSGESSVRFNNKEPNYANIGIYFYTYDFSGLSDMTFKFTRSKNEVYENNASKSDVIPITIPLDFTTVNASNNTILTWEGDPIGEDEMVQITIESDRIGVNYFYFEQIGTTSATIQFPEPVKTGQATLSLSRVKKLPLQQSDGPAGGEIKVIYTVSKTIEIK